MTIARSIGRQLALPNGMAGRLLGRVMDLANRRPTQFAVEWLGPRDGERILDIGCGTGAASEMLLRAADCQVTCVDRSPTMLSQARRRLGQRATFQQTSLGTLPFPDHGFDAALALNLLYFCDEAGTMVADLKRVLRPGGRLMVYVTDRASMEAWPFVRHGTHRLFDETALVEALVAGGFVADRICVHAWRVTRRVRGLLAYAEA